MSQKRRQDREFVRTPAPETEKEKGDEWTPISSDPNILNKWLSGDVDVDSLRDWLKEIYPSSMHDTIEDALYDEGLGEKVEKEERKPKPTRTWSCDKKD